MGFLDKVGDAAIFVDPLNKKEITEKIIWLADPKNRAAQAEKVRQISFSHSWKEIADEILEFGDKIYAIFNLNEQRTDIARISEIETP